MSFQLQLLHASDLEGGVDAIQNAPNFAAIANYFETTFTPDDGNTGGTLIISAGDNYIPGPFFGAGAEIRSEQQDVFERFYGLEAGTLSQLEADSGRVDIGIMNIIGFDASAVGNHEFDAGTSLFEPGNSSATVSPEFDFGNFDGGNGPGLGADPINGFEWFGANFPYLSVNLDWSADEAAGVFTDEIRPVEAYITNPSDQTFIDNAVNTPEKVAPSSFAVVDGNLVGIIGLTTPAVESISSTGLVDVIDPETTDQSLIPTILPGVADLINAEVARHRALGVETIILTSHLQQFGFEEELAPLLNGVDVIIAGGSDTILLDENDVARGGDTADRNEYPVLTTNAEGNPVAIVSTNGEYTYVGRLVVEFDENGNLVADSIDAVESGSYETTNDGVLRVVTDGSATVDGDSISFTENSVADLVQDLAGAVEAVVIERDALILAESDVFLEGRRTQVRTEETNLSNAIGDGQIFYAQQFDPTVQISIQNGGGIRAEIGSIENDPDTGVTTLGPTEANPLSGKEAGEVSALDVENTLRFDNALTLLTLTAEEILQVVEHGVSSSSEVFGEATPGQFIQVSGLTFSFDPSLPANERVGFLAVTDEDGNIIDVLANNGEIVGDANRTYRIVTNSFIADGGDGYPFADFAAADPSRVNVVGLRDEGVDPATFDPGRVEVTETGGQRDAFAEYLAFLSEQGTTFDTAETPVTEDLRIQNLTQRDFASIDTDAVVTAVVGANGAPTYVAGADTADGTVAGSFQALPDDADQGVDVFRFVNAANGDTVLTTSTVEADAIRSAGLLTDDGSVFNAFATDQGDATIPVFRVFSTGLGHVYTADEAERDAFLADGFLDEGVAFFVFGSDVDLIG